MMFPSIQNTETKDQQDLIDSRCHFRQYFNTDNTRTGFNAIQITTRNDA